MTANVGIRDSRGLVGRGVRFLRRRIHGLRHRIDAWKMPARIDEQDVPEMVAVRFYALDQWQDWLVNHQAEKRSAMTSRLLRTVRRQGFVEPLTGRKFRPSEIVISTDNLRESLVAGSISSRMRAVLLCIEREAAVASNDLRLLAAESVTSFAALLRDKFPNFVGTEYLPGEAEKVALPGVQHVDIQDMHFGDRSFDLFVSGDVMEHVPEPEQAISEISRILAPGGVVISTFPFLSGQQETLVKASIGEDGAIAFHAEPEYHGNPVDIEGGSLVFTVPAWDVLDLYRKYGFEDVYMLGVYSVRHAIISQDTPVVLVLVAQKPVLPVDTDR